jgi:hypothetical protein
MLGLTIAIVALLFFIFLAICTVGGTLNKIHEDLGTFLTAMSEISNEVQTIADNSDNESKYAEIALEISKSVNNMKGADTNGK